MFLVTALFPVYYNVLSQFVSRRDELVLKRMRTGEARDAELLRQHRAARRDERAACSPRSPSRSPPLLGQPLPVNPLLYAAMAVLAVVMFTAFAYWTAAWTKNAEAAQLTSLPLIILASIGPMTNTIPDMPDRLRDILSLTPGRRDVRPGPNRLVRLRRPGATEPTLTLRRDLGPSGRTAARDRRLDVHRRHARPTLDAMGTAHLTTAAPHQAHASALGSVSRVRRHRHQTINRQRDSTEPSVRPKIRASEPVATSRKHRTRPSRQRRRHYDMETE